MKDKEERKQDPPQTWRPYPPVKEALEKYGPDNLNYMINSALGEKLGIPESLIEAYKRKK